MEYKQIKELIKLVNSDDSNIGELVIEEGDFKFKITHKNYTKKLIQSNGGSIAVPQQSIAIPNSTEGLTIKETDTALDNSNKGKDGKNELSEEKENGVEIKSPMIGTFYRSPAPDKEPYIKVGDHVNEGDILCVIEAMKLFNEIESEVSGKIIKVLVDNSSPVEYDQPLFLIDPS